MENKIDTGNKDYYQSYQLYKDDAVVATIYTYDSEGDQALRDIFSIPQSRPLIHLPQ